RAPRGGLMSAHQSLVTLLLELSREIRDAVVTACTQQSEAELSLVADDGPGDTIYRIDKVSEELLLERLGAKAVALGGLVLIAEGIPGGEVTLPSGFSGTPAWRFIVDPIDGTRCIMYQKRSAWVLCAVA